jgi:hypothetical protein
MEAARRKFRSKSNTKFSLYIVESLDFDDEPRRREGRILRDILRLADHKVHYMYIRTRKELEEVLYQFQDSGSRYLHLSSHGNKANIGLTLDRIPFSEFGKMVRPFLKERRLFVSACEVVNDGLAAAVLPSSKCHSLIGPNYQINMDDAVLMWSSFYHLMFRDPEIKVMKSGKIRWALRRVRDAFAGDGMRSDFTYAKPTKNKNGYRWVDIEERETDPSDID